MSKHIQVHREYGGRLLLNVAAIDTIDEIKRGCLITVQSGATYTVVDSYDVLQRVLAQKEASTPKG